MRLMDMVAAFSVVSCVVGTNAARAGDSDAEVYVVHGIPGIDLELNPALPVDVSVNGGCVLEGFTFGEIVGPLTLPAGEYDIAISLANEMEPCSNEAVIAATVPLAQLDSYAIVAYLTSDGSPTAGLFPLDLSPALPGTARAIVQHTAAAPLVDVELRRGNARSRGIEIEEFSNGEQQTANVRPGSWNVSITPTGEHVVVFGPVKIVLEPSSAYLIFAVGSLENETFTLLIEQVGI